MKSHYTHIVPLVEVLRESLYTIFNSAVVEEACRANGWFSPQDIAYALEAIEGQMLDEEKLHDWLTSQLPTGAAPEARNVGVICAGNIPLAGFFDVMCVLAAGHRCFVKPSSKDEVLMMALYDFLRSQGAEIELLHQSTTTLDAIIASGSDTAIESIGHTYGSIPSLLRGHRTSVAVICGSESQQELALLGDDLFRYNSMGCRNVTLVWLPKGYNIEEIARGVQPCKSLLSPKYLNNYRQLRATAILTGEEVYEGGFFLLKESTEPPTRLAQVSFATYDTTEQLKRWLNKNDSLTQCVVSLNKWYNHPRSAPMGEAQRPTLYDWPDGINTLDWLRNHI